MTEIPDDRPAMREYNYSSATWHRGDLVDGERVVRKDKADAMRDEFLAALADDEAAMQGLRWNHLHEFKRANKAEAALAEARERISELEQMIQEAVEDDNIGGLMTAFFPAPPAEETP